MKTLHINDIITGTDLNNTTFEFTLKSSIGVKTGTYITLDLGDLKYNTFLIYRNKIGTKIQLIIKGAI